MPSTAGHILYHAKHFQAIPYTMPCPQGHIIYRRLTLPGHYDILCHARQTIPCQCNIPCDAHQAIPVTMPCPPDYIICHDITDRTYHAMPARPFQVHVILPSHTICNPIPHQAIPYTMPYLQGHTIYHARPAKQYHISFHAHQATA